MNIFKLFTKPQPRDVDDSVLQSKIDVLVYKYDDAARRATDSNQLNRRLQDALARQKNLCQEQVRRNGELESELQIVKCELDEARKKAIFRGKAGRFVSSQPQSKPKTARKPRVAKTKEATDE